MSSSLDPKTCPVCGRDCVLKEGKAGPFMGCPDWPRCPGKVVRAFTDRDRERTNGKLDTCFDFIAKIGGCVEAEKWLKIAVQIVNAAASGDKL